MTTGQTERQTLDLWPEVGRRLGLSKNATYQAARCNQIPGLFRIGARLLVRREIFDAFMAGRTSGDQKPIAAGFPPGMETR